MRSAIPALVALCVFGCGDETPSSWKNELGWGAASPVVVGGGRAYFGARSTFGGTAWLQAYTADGKLVWDREGGEVILGDNGLLYGQSGPLVFAVEPDSGDIRWYAEAGGQLAVRSDGWVFSTWQTFEQQQLGKTTLAGVTPAGAIAWTQEVFGTPVAAPVIASDAIVWLLVTDAGGGNAMKGFDRDGAQQHEIALPGPPNDVALGADGTFYVGGQGYLKVITDNGGGGYEMSLNAADTGGPVSVSGLVIGQDGRIYANADGGLVSIEVEGDDRGVRWIQPAAAGGIAASRDGRLYITSGTELKEVRASNGEILSSTDHFNITHTVGPPALAGGRAYFAGHFFLNETYYGANSELLGAEQAFLGYGHAYGGAGGPATSGWYRSGVGNNGATRAAPVPASALGEPTPSRGPEAGLGRFLGGAGQLPVPRVVVPLSGRRMLMSSAGWYGSAHFPDYDGAPVRAGVDRAQVWLGVRDDAGWTALTFVDTTDDVDRQNVPSDRGQVDAAAELNDGTIVVAGNLFVDDSGPKALVGFAADLKPVWSLAADEAVQALAVGRTDEGFALITRGPAGAGVELRWYAGGEGEAPREIGAVRFAADEVPSEAWAVAPSGRVYLAGAGADMDGQPATRVAAVEPGGAVVWRRSFPGRAYPVSAAVGPDGQLALGGPLYADANFGHGVLRAGDTQASWAGFVAVMDAQGQPLWSHRVGAQTGRGVSGVTIDSVGNVTVAGNLGTDFELAGRRFATRGVDHVAVQFDADGRPLWARTNYAQPFGPGLAFTDEDDDLILYGGLPAFTGFGDGAIDMRFEALVASRARAPFAAAGYVRLKGAGALAAELDPPAPPNMGGGETVEVDVDGPGRVVSEPAGIDCPGTCVAAFPSLSEVRLRAEPDPGGHFVRWTDGPCDTAPECTFTVREPVDVEVEFARPGIGWAVRLPDGLRVGAGAPVTEGLALAAFASSAVQLPGGEVQPGQVALFGVDPNGAITWSRAIDGAIGAVTMAPTPDGGFVFGATVQANATDLGAGPLAPIGRGDMVLGRYDAGGAPVWTRRYTPSLARVHVADDGGLLVVARPHGGTFGALEVPETQAHFIAALDPDGEPRWVHLLDEWVGVFDVVGLAGGRAVAVLSWADVQVDRREDVIFLVRLDANGERVATAPVITGNLRRVQAERAHLLPMGEDVLFSIASSAAEPLLDASAFAGAPGFMGVWAADGTFSWVVPLVEDGAGRPEGLVALTDGRVASLTLGEGPFNDPMARRRRFKGPHLTVFDGSEAAVVMPAWATEDNEAGLGPQHIFALPDGGVAAVVEPAEARVYLGQSVEPGTWLFGLRP